MEIVLVIVLIINKDGLLIFMKKNYDVIIVENVVLGIVFFVSGDSGGNGVFCFFVEEDKFLFDFECILDDIRIIVIFDYF